LDDAVKALLRLIAGAVTISFSAVFVKLVAVPPTTSAAYRMAVGGAVLLGWVAARGELRLPRRWAALLLGGAGLCFALDLYFWHRSILYIGPGLATLLANFQVFILPLAGWVLYRQPPHVRQLLAIPIALLGLALIVGFDWRALPADYQLGVGFGLMTALCYAGYILFLQRARQRDYSGSNANDLGWLSGVSAVLLALAALVAGETMAIPSLQEGALLLTYGLVSQVIGAFLIAGALARLSAGTVGLVLLLQPLMAFVWDVSLFARPFTLLELGGAATALLAIYVGSRVPLDASGNDKIGQD
jgi:drug/metabolite transporter (DMT)-like permease